MPVLHPFPVGVREQEKKTGDKRCACVQAAVEAKVNKLLNHAASQSANGR